MGSLVALLELTDRLLLPPVFFCMSPCFNRWRKWISNWIINMFSSLLIKFYWSKKVSSKCTSVSKVTVNTHCEEEFHCQMESPPKTSSKAKDAVIQALSVLCAASPRQMLLCSTSDAFPSLQMVLISNGWWCQQWGAISQRWTFVLVYSLLVLLMKQHVQIPHLSNKQAKYSTSLPKLLLFAFHVTGWKIT